MISWFIAWKCLMFRLIRQFFGLIAIWLQSRNYKGKVRFALVRTNPESRTFPQSIYSFFTWISITGPISICEPVCGPYCATLIVLNAFQQFSQFLSNYPTILVPVMTPVSASQCPILCHNFSILMKQIRTLQSQPLCRNNSTSRTCSRTALIRTHQLSLPSVGAFTQSVQLKGGKLLFLSWILTV